MDDAEKSAFDVDGTQTGAFGFERGAAVEVVLKERDGEAAEGVEDVAERAVGADVFEQRDCAAGADDAAELGEGARAIRPSRRRA